MSGVLLKHGEESVQHVHDDGCDGCGGDDGGSIGGSSRGAGGGWVVGW